MSSRPLLAEKLDNEAAALRLRFERSGLLGRHSGSKGAIRESLFAEFLRESLPRTVEILGSAEIVTPAGDFSPQCDVVIVDPAIPPFLITDGHRIVPNECVFGVIEVKSHLDKKELEDSCTKIAKVKALSKSAFNWGSDGPRHQFRAYGQSWPYWPTTGSIFAFGSVDLDTLACHLMDWCGPRPAIEWPDSVWVLGKGSLTWSPKGTRQIGLLAEDGAGLLALAPIAGRDVLLPMTLSFSTLFGQARMPAFDLMEYAGNATLGAVIGHYEWDDPSRS